MVLQIRHIEKSFGTVPVLRGIDLSLSEGDSVALTGESGSGKSTLLHLVGGLDSPDKGEIILDGTSVSAANDKGRADVRRTLVGIVFQQFNLIPSLTVAANIAFHAQLAGRHDPKWCLALTDELGLSTHLNKYPETLSGGQQQRVAIARALAAKPKLVLADEPTGNLDEDTADTVLNLMISLLAESGTALLMVTHSDRHAERLSRRVHLSGGRIAI